MGFDLESDNDYALHRMEHLERRYRRARFVLAGANMQYNSLRNTPGVPEAQLTQAIYRVERARELLEDILSTIEFLEDQSFSAIAVHRVSRRA